MKSRSLRAAFGFALLVAISPGAGAVPVRHTVAAKLDPETGRFEAVDRFHVRRRNGVLEFGLAPWLEIVWAKVNSRPVRVLGEGTRRRLALDGGAAATVELAYRGRIPRGGDGRKQTMGVWAGADGVFLPAGSLWLPELDEEAAAFRVVIDVPKGQRVVATGRLVFEETSAGGYRAVFESGPAEGTPTLLAGPYAIAERMAGTVRVRTYFHRDVASLAGIYLKQAARFIARYSEQIAPYPYAGFSIVSSPLPVGLGFPGLAYVARRILPLPFMRERSLAHEILHNWWGNGVRVAAAGGDWAEGLTTYLADHALAVEKGSAKARRMRFGWLRDFAALPSGRVQPLRSFRSERHDAARIVGYGKAAFVFHMLRDEIGVETFANGVRLLWRRYRFREAGWDDLRRVFEEVSGTSLEAFFDQWLGRADAPRLELVEARPIRLDAGRAGLALTLGQRRPGYRLSVPVVVETALGTERFRVSLFGLRTQVQRALRAPARRVLVDPGYDLFRRLAPEEAPPILRDVTLRPDATAVFVAPDGATRRIARRLAARLLDNSVEVVDSPSAAPPDGALLIVGTGRELIYRLASWGLGPVPEAIAGKGTARVWAGRLVRGAPYVVVAARDGSALRALERPLPHFRGRGYLAFEGARAIVVGDWPARSDLLQRVMAP